MPVSPTTAIIHQLEQENTKLKAVTQEQEGTIRRLRTQLTVARNDTFIARRRLRNVRLAGDDD